MTNRRLMEILIERYGAPVRVNGNETVALIQPLRGGGSLSEKISGLQEDRAYFSYTGPAGTPPEPGDEVDCGGQSYAALRGGTFETGGEAVYAWAVLRRLAPEERAEILVRADGAVAARAQSCTEKAEQGCKPSTVWGEREAAAVKPGVVGYTLLLYGVQPEPGADLTALSDFSVTVRRGKVLTVYAGCRWKSVETESGLLSKQVQTLTVTAAKRTVEKGE